MLKETIFVVISINCVFCVHYFINDEVILENVNRTINLDSQIAKICNIIKFTNYGYPVVHEVVYCLETQMEPAYITFDKVPKSELGLDLSPIKIPSLPDKKCWRIILYGELRHEQAITIEVNEYWTNVITPYPKYITQYEDQYFVYRGNVVLYSPYKINKMITTVNVNTNNINSYSEIHPTINEKDKITYGPYFKLSEFSSIPFDVHYLDNRPFLVVKNLERVITVSHWGSITVEETTELCNNGAKIKGPFSHLDYAMFQRNSSPAIESYNMSLPATATNIQFYDDLGNISTSFPQVHKNEIILTVEPRYPLLGGWKIKHVVRYNVPCFKYLKRAGNEYFLKMNIIDRVYTGMVVERLTTKILLPRDVYKVFVTIPFPVKESTHDLYYTKIVNHSFFDNLDYVDIMFTKENLIEHHIQEFYIEYWCSSIHLLRKPIQYILIIFSLFIISIIYNHLDFSIYKNIIHYPNQIAKLCKKLKVHQEKRFGLYRTYDNELSKLKMSKDINSFHSSMKSVNNEFKTEANIISHICKKLTPVKEMTQKLLNLQHFDKLLMEQYLEHQKFCLDMFTSGRIVRQVLRETENMFFIKRNALLEVLTQTFKSID